MKRYDKDPQDLKMMSKSCYSRPGQECKEFIVRALERGFKYQESDCTKAGKLRMNFLLSGMSCATCLGIKLQICCA